MLTDPHHDGSALYVANPAPDPGEDVAVFLRVPRGSDITRAHLCTVIDGERQLFEAVLDRQDERDSWYRADLPMHNPVMGYRWLLDGGPHHYQWYNGSGLHPHDVTDAEDFRLASYPPPPAWGTDTVLWLSGHECGSSGDRFVG